MGDGTTTHIFGLDIGGTKTAVSRLREDGGVEETLRFPTSGYAATMERATRELRALHAGSDSLIGISCGSPLDGKRGLIQSPPNLKGWDGVPICDDLKAAFGGRAHLMNDANACALAEWWFGAGVGCKSMVFLTSGTGMGSGLILNGRLYEGASGDAGEVGHVRLGKEGPFGYGKNGTFEGYCSGGGIARLALLRLPATGPLPPWADPKEAVTAKGIAEAASRGDAIALGIMRESGQRLGEALAILIDVLNPEKIVIGGFFASCRLLLEPAMRPILAEEALPSSLARCEIVPAKLGETIGSHGAISAALYSAGIDPAAVRPAGR